jgi:ABC-type enterochelin transport system permease subunit
LVLSTGVVVRVSLSVVGMGVAVAVGDGVLGSPVWVPDVTGVLIRVSGVVLVCVGAIPLLGVAVAGRGVGSTGVGGNVLVSKPVPSVWIRKRLRVNGFPSRSETNTMVSVNVVLVS